MINRINELSNKRALLLVISSFALLMSYFLTSNADLSKPPSSPTKSVANILFHASDAHITNFNANEPIVWQRLDTGEFNLGRQQFGLFQINVNTSSLKRLHKPMLAIVRNNVYSTVTLYYQQDDKLISKTFQPYTEDEKLLAIELPNAANQHTWYVAISGSYSRGKIHILAANDLVKLVKQTSLTEGIYFGITSLFFLFSLVCFLVLRKPIFCKYATVIMLISLWVAAGEGWLKTYFPQLINLPFFTANSLGLLFFLSFAYFSQDYLKLKQHEITLSNILKYNQLVLLLIWLSYCITFNRANPVLYQVVYGFALVSCLVVLTTSFIAAIRALKSRQLQSVFYLAAISTFFFCGVVSALSMTSLLDIYVGWTLIKFASLLELILFAIGLVFWQQNSLSKLVNEQNHRVNLQTELTSTKQLLAQQQVQLEAMPNHTLTCQQMAKVVSLRDKTLFIKASGNYSTVYYRDGSTLKETLIDKNIQVIETTLGSEWLVRCHKSFMVSIKQPFQLTRRTSADFDLVLDAHKIPVGRKYLKDIKAAFKRV